MIGKSKCFLLFTVLFRCCFTDVNGEDYQLLLNDNSPVTTGSTVTLNATVLDGSGRCAKGVLTYRYEDDAFPTHKNETTVEKCEAIFQIPFNTTVGPSIYRYQVDVFHQLLPFLKIPIASGRGQLNITENLNGQLLVYQNNVNISKNSAAQTTYISSSSEVLHKVEINAADHEYLNKSANSVVVYWFVDCVYKGKSTDFTFSSNYTQSETQHEILGIVVANIGPPPKPNPPTPKPLPVNTTTASPNVTISTTTTTTAAGVAADTASYSAPDVSNVTMTTSTPETDLIPSNHIINSTYTSDCQQKDNVDLLLSSAVQLEDQQKYGYFSRLLLVKDPISNVRTQGKVWIQEGEMLNLQMSCNGSGPFRYCAHYVQGPYNVTGNETCTWDRNLVQCQMQFFHYFREPTNYTLVIIMANDVSKIVTPIGINIYKVQKLPQISVIVVPVTFSSIAVIIIVFGIAYYFQNRSRYMVEVADFDFANNSDMEYKTFRERLRDAITQAINRTQDYSEYDGSEEHIGGLVTPQNQKYGSMQ